MMLIGRSSGRENLLWVTGVEPMPLIRTHLANHIRASSHENGLHQQARHMTLMSQVKHKARGYPVPTRTGMKLGYRWIVQRRGRDLKTSVNKL
jgi:hypothetical protein